ncbi:PatB family C-S lyase [Acidithiobacillus sp. AMEEHan]|uniref:MalY/PatB family protein n=1 Tax=Acidithiobacillus sp. AMEEHan TaxID=2994951 RepID=UPI0027E523A8|nr:PatB family C-S lyase [Acidithiobacillus sp. AMEEHan]
MRETQFDFDTVNDRWHTDSVKWAGARRKFGRPVFPMWVADMDFPAAPNILHALEQRLAEPVLGYPDHDEMVHEAAAEWWHQRHSWTVTTEEVILVQGVVPALNAAVRAFSQPGDGIIVMPPVYPPFFAAVTGQGRRLISVPLRMDAGLRYEMDFASLAAQVAQAKMLLLCSPHNPVGRVWTTQELQQLVSLCRPHGVRIVSDEIHADLSFPEQAHTPMGKLDPSAIVLASASKSFNVAGLGGAVAWLRGVEAKAQLVEELRRSGILGTHTFAKTALRAAWQEGGPWLRALQSYLGENAQFLASYLQQYLPEVGFRKPDFGYLAWLDLRAWRLSDEEIEARILAAGLGLNWGPSFGEGGSGFVRLNFGTPRKFLAHGLDLLRRAAAQA